MAAKLSQCGPASTAQPDVETSVPESAASDLDVLQRAVHLGPRVGQGLAHFLDQDVTDFLEVVAEQPGQLEQRRDPLVDRRGGPGGESRVGGIDGGVGLFGARQGDSSDDLSGAGIFDVQPFAALGFDPFAVDVV